MLHPHFDATAVWFRYQQYHVSRPMPLDSSHSLLTVPPVCSAEVPWPAGVNKSDLLREEFGVPDVLANNWVSGENAVPGT